MAEIVTLKSSTLATGARPWMLPGELMPEREALSLQAEAALKMAAVDPLQAWGFVRKMRNTGGGWAALAVGDTALMRGQAKLAATAYEFAGLQFGMEWRTIGTAGEVASWYGRALVACGCGDIWEALGALDRGRQILQLAGACSSGDAVVLRGAAEVLEAVADRVGKVFLVGV